MSKCDIDQFVITNPDYC